MLEWYVYDYDYNQNKIEPFNVFEHGRFYEDCKRNARKNKDNYDAFIKQLRMDLAYYFWSKSEWEVVIIPWTSRSDPCSLKVDVYEQVMLNWEKFADYVCEHAVELRRREKKK